MRHRQGNKSSKSSPLEISNMSELCDLRGLRHCRTLGLSLALVYLPWSASFLLKFNSIYILHSDGRWVLTPECPLWPHNCVLFVWCPYQSHYLKKSSGVKLDFQAKIHEILPHKCTCCLCWFLMLASLNEKKFHIIRRSMIFFHFWAPILWHHWSHSFTSLCPRNKERNWCSPFMWVGIVKPAVAAKYKSLPRAGVSAIFLFPAPVSMTTAYQQEWNIQCGTLLNLWLVDAAVLKLSVRWHPPFLHSRKFCKPTYNDSWRKKRRIFLRQLSIIASVCLSRLWIILTPRRRFRWNSM